MKKTTMFATASALLVLAWTAYWVFFSGDVFATHAANEGNRIAMLRVQASLDASDEYERVLRTFWRESFRSSLRLNVQSRDVWYATMPAEFGGRDWVLQIRFHAGALNETRVVDSDGRPVTHDVGPVTL